MSLTPCSRRAEVADLVHFGTSSREKAVRELLARHIGELDDDIHTFLVEQLKIPASLIKSVQETYGEEEEDPDRE